MLCTHRFWPAVAIWFTYSAAQAQQPVSVTEVASRVTKSLVLITTHDKSGKDIGLGSGFIVGQDGFIATNLHVIEGAYAASVRLYNGDVYDTVFVVDSDKRKDLALIRIKAIQLPVIALGDSEKIQIGQHVIAVGNPEGLLGSVSDGIISAVRQFTGYKAIQTTCPISPGSSGGALLNEAGEVIGLTQGQFEGQNLNVAIPINYLKPLLQFSSPQQLTTLDVFNAGNLKTAETAEPPPPAAQGTALTKPTLDGDWSATVADARGSASVKFNLIQNSEGDVVGTYTTSLGGGGSIKGKIQDIHFLFELTQSIQNCPGIFKGTAEISSAAIAGTYTGADCQGDHGKGTLTMTRPGSQATPATVTQVVPDVMKNDPTGFLEKQLRVWTPQSARLVLGDPVRRRNSVDQSNNVNGDIYAYPDPTRLNREFELDFDHTTGALSLIIVYPWSMTWDQCKALWGDNVKTTKNPNGTRFHAYRNRHVNVLVAADGKVINFGIY